MKEPAKRHETLRVAHRPPAPLLLPALGLAAGIAFDRWAGAGAAPYLFGMLVGVVLPVWPFARRECVKLIVVLLAFCTGGLSHSRQVDRLPADHVLRYTRNVPVLGRVTGTVVTRPRLPRKRSHVFSPWWYETGRTVFLLDADGVETAAAWAPVVGTVKVSVKAPVVTLAVGDRVEVFGWCYRPRPPDNPGQFDWAEHQRRHGLFVNLTCNHRECVRKLADAERTVAALWARMRQRARVLLLDELLTTGGPETTLLDTLVLGRRGSIEPRLNEVFVRIGCAHYLAVSGMHVGMIAVFVWFVGRALGAPSRGCAGAVIVVSVFYALIADPRPPILRATIMTIAVCTGLLLGRPRNFLNGLSLAAIVILTVGPAQLFDVGFQLSFSAVLAIVYLSPLLMDIPRRLRPSVVRSGGDDDIDLFVERRAATAAGRARRWLELRFWWMLSASTVAWMTSLPTVLIHFDRFSPWGWLTSLLLFPLVLVLMAASFTKLLCALVWPTLAPLLTTPVQWLASLLIHEVELLDHLPAAPVIPWWLAVLVGASLIVWAGQRRWAHGRRLSGILACVSLVGLAWWLAPARGDGRLTMTVLSVGRGTSIVLELPDGRVVLYDTGASGSYDPGASIIMPFLRHRGIRRIDAAFISHPNLDHFSGLPTVIDRVRTGPVYITPYFEPLSTGGKPSRALLDELRAHHAPVRIVNARSRSLVFGNVVFELLWPPPDLGDDVACNETSLVARITYAGRSILLTGDIETLAQGRLLAGADLRADVLLLPHHGSPRHNTLDFVEAVAPEVLISSTFVRRTEQGPGFDRIVGRRRHFNTTDHGAVTVILDRTGIIVRTHLDHIPQIAEP